MIHSQDPCLPLATTLAALLAASLAALAAPLATAAPAEKESLQKKRKRESDEISQPMSPDVSQPLSRQEFRGFLEDFDFVNGIYARAIVVPALVAVKQVFREVQLLAEHVPKLPTLLSDTVRQIRMSCKDWKRTAATTTSTPPRRSKPPLRNSFKQPSSGRRR